MDWLPNAKDKSSVVGIAAGILVALISGATSYFVAVRQGDLALLQMEQRLREFNVQSTQKDSEILATRAEVVHQFFPDFSKDDRTRQAAIEVIGTMDPLLGARLGDIYKDKGGTAALVTLTKTSDQLVSKPAREALIGRLPAPSPHAPTASSSPAAGRVQEIALRGTADVTARLRDGGAVLIVYDAFLFDSAGKNPQQIKKGTNVDSVSDEFTVGSPSELDGRVLSIQLLLQNPVASGGSPEGATVEILQNDEIVATQTTMMGPTGVRSAVLFWKFSR